MIRVLQVVGKMNRGGLESFIMNVYRHIDRNAIQFDFLVHTDKKGDFDDEIESMGGKIFRVIPRRKGLHANRVSVENFFKVHANEYNAIHSHLSSLVYTLPTDLAQKYNIPVRIIHSHNTAEGGFWLNKYIHFYKRLFFKKNATHFFACSALAGIWMFGKRKFSKGQVQVIKNGIDSESFDYNPKKRNQMRETLSVGDCLVIGHVGRFNAVKNHSFLIDIFCELLKKIEHAKLILVGRGNLELQIKEKVRNLGLSNSVIFAGVRSDVNSIYQAMDIFVFPSIYEGLPVTLVEAQASGLPCLISNSITKEVCLTENCITMDITESASVWADWIVKNISYVRKNRKDDIVKHGYDIHDIVNTLTSYYLS